MAVNNWIAGYTSNSITTAFCLKWHSDCYGKCWQCMSTGKRYLGLGKLQCRNSSNSGYILKLWKTQFLFFKLAYQVNWFSYSVFIHRFCLSSPLLTSLLIISLPIICSPQTPIVCCHFCNMCVLSPSTPHFMIYQWIIKCETQRKDKYKFGGFGLSDLDSESPKWVKSGSFYMGKATGGSQVSACIHFEFKMYSKLPGVYVE